MNQSINVVCIWCFLFLFSCESNSESQDNCIDEIVNEASIEAQKSERFRNIGETPNEIIKALKGVKSYDDLLSYIKERGAKNNHRARQLDFNSFHLIEDIWTKNKLRINLSYLLHDDSISLIRLASIDSNYVEIHGAELIEVDRELAIKYVSKHNQHYGTKKRIADIETELLSAFHRVALACGYGATFYDSLAIEMLQAANNNDIKYITSLLTSLSPENQTLGILGIMRMEQLGFKSDIETQKVIKHLKAKNTSICACITCAGGYFELKNYLRAYKWEEVFQKCPRY